MSSVHQSSTVSVHAKMLRGIQSRLDSANHSSYSVFSITLMHLRKEPALQPFNAAGASMENLYQFSNPLPGLHSVCIALHGQKQMYTGRVFLMDHPTISYTTVSAILRVNSHAFVASLSAQFCATG